MKVKVRVAQSCPTLCDPVDCSLPGSSVHGILQARVLEWVAISFSRESSWPRDLIWVSCTAGRFLTNWATREATNKRGHCTEKFSGVWLFATPWIVAHQVLLSMGILQARILEWVAMPSFRGSCLPRDLSQVSTLQVYSLPSEPPGNVYLIQEFPTMFLPGKSWIPRYENSPTS